MRLRASVHSDLLTGDLHVRRVVAKEGLSVLFDVEVELLSEKPDVDLESLIWSTALVAIEDREGGGDPVVFHGVIEEAEYTGAIDQRFGYRLRLRPRIHGLAYRVRSRIFQGLDAPGIVKRVLADAGIPDSAVRWKLAERYPVREYGVQYRESELSYCLRLLEDEGIFYWFEHGEAGHVLVLGDSPAQHGPIDGATALPFSKWHQDDRESVTELVFSRRLCNDAWSSLDWSWRSPEKPLFAEERPESGALYERYEFPGYYDDADAGARRAKVCLAERTLERYTIEAHSTCRRLEPGRTFSLTRARPEFLCRDWLLVRLEHAFSDTGEGGARYEVALLAMPADREFRPARVTPRPKVYGKEIAVVTGPPGEEIHVDRHGRIKAHFCWDREGAVDDTASCWIRVQQQNTAGAMLLPRVGWELSVGFVEGDPDRPIALQKLYNQETMPPYPLPGKVAQSALQSSSSPGGGGTNEVRLDDSNGAMEFFVHASKDLALDCHHDLGEDITVDSSEEVGLTLQTKVGSNETVSVGADQTTSITGSAALQTDASKSETVGGMDDWGIQKNFTVISEGARNETISVLQNVLANKVSESFSGTCDRTVGAALAMSAVTAIVEAVGGNKTESVGGAKMELLAKAKAENIGIAKVLTAGLIQEKVGKAYSVEARGTLTFTIGGAMKEKVGKDFTLDAKTIKVTAPGGALFKAGGNKLRLKGGTLRLDASKLGAAGGPKLVLKGQINYEDP